MIRVSLRNLLVSKLRLFLTVAAVTVGVAFVSGTFVLSDTMTKAFDELYAGLTSGTDVVVRAEAAYDVDLDTMSPLPSLDAAVLTKVQAVEGVEVAEGSVAGFALLLDKHGKPMQPGGAPTLGVSIGQDARLAGDFGFRAGDRPHGPDEVVIDAASAKKAGYRVGDSVDVVVTDSRRTFTLVGIVGFRDTDSLAGATLAGFDLATAQQLLDKEGVLDEIDARAVRGVSDVELRDAVSAVLPPGAEAVTGAQVAADGSAAVRDAMGIFTTVLLVFAGVSLLVGSFVIWNTFNVLVAQRRREVALLRAVGATQRQVLVGVLVEAAVVGVVAGLAGLGAGVGLAAGIRSLLKLAGIEIPTTTPDLALRTILAALGVGIVVTVLAALAPAWSATRVSPMEALRDAVPSAAGGGALRRRAGWLLTLAGFGGLVACAVIADQPWWTAAATLVAFAGLVTAGPALARGVASIADRGRRGNAWKLAARNVARNARRSAATALALTIGLTVVSAVAVTAASMKESVSVAVTGANRSDLILQPAGTGSGISTAVVDLLAKSPHVADLVEFRQSGAQVAGDNTVVVGADTQGLGDVIDLGVADGSLAALGPGRAILGVGRAEDLGVQVGDTITVLFPESESGATEVEVVGTFTQESFLGSTVVLSMDDFAAQVRSRLDSAILLNAAPGTTGAALKSEVKAAVAEYPNVVVSDPADLTQDAQDSVDQLLGLVTALLLLAVIVAILGIVNTLVLSVMERTREYGLMRAVGATSGQVRRIVRRESVLMALLGAVTGVVLGTVAGIALSRALHGEGITSIAVPTSMLILYLVVAALVGVLAAIGPARRASRVNVLRAITTE